MLQMKPAGNGAPPGAAPVVGAGKAALTEAERVELRRVTGTRISLAYTAFTSACQSNARAVQNAAKAQAEMAALFVDVAMGFLTPGLTRGIAAAVNRIPAQASNLTYKLALAAQDADFMKALFGGATKVGNQMLKSNATALFGEGETEVFLRNLEVQAQASFQAVSDNLSTLSDDALGATCAGYDAGVTNASTYASAVSDLVAKFKSQVEPIGDSKMMAGGGMWVTNQDKAFWVVDGPSRRLAMLHASTNGYQPAPKYSFKTWVSPEMQEMAIARTKGVTGGLQTVNRSEVSGLSQRAAKLAARC